MSLHKNCAISFVLLSLLSCGGGGGGGEQPTDVGGSNHGDNNENQDSDTVTESVTNCSAVGQDLGGDVVGNEYFEGGTMTSLLFGDSIGGNEESNSNLVKRLQLNSCTSVSGIEFGSAYVLNESNAFAGALDYAFEVRNVTDKLICKVSAEFEVRDSAGQRIQGDIQGSTTEESYTSFAQGRYASIPDPESGFLTNEQSSSCLRPNEIAYIFASERRRDVLLGQVLYDAFDEAANLNIRSVSFSDDEWIELPPFFSVNSYIAPESNNSNVRFEFELSPIDLASEQGNTFERLVPRQSLTSAFVRYTLLDSLGQPLYIGGSTNDILSNDSAMARLFFSGSVNSVRFRQGFRLDIGL